MLVKELRDIVKKYNEEDKEKIIIELYKKIPKRVKEDYDIDNYILNINNKVTKEEKKISFEDLEKEVIYFLECARSELYSSPNRIIPKTERSKWRFKVKRFYKELNSFLPDTEEGNRATDLLKSLYKVLSHGTHYLLFSSWETFKAVQVSQAEFLEIIAKRKLVNGLIKENLLYCIDLLDVEYDPYDYHRSLLIAFETCLKTIDAKYMAIDLLKEEKDKKYVELLTLKKDKRISSHLLYDKKEKINYFVECILDIYFDLSEVEEAIKYFHKNYLKDNKEVKEYILLEFLEDNELYKEWIIEYEKHVGKIDYRESLKNKYNELKQTINN